MKRRIDVNNLTREDLDNTDGDISVDDLDGVERQIFESQSIVPPRGRDAPAHEATDLVIKGSYNDVREKLNTYEKKPLILHAICLGCGVANDHPKTPSGHYCFACAKRGATPCRSPGCDNDGYLSEQAGVTMFYCSIHGGSEIYESSVT